MEKQWTSHPNFDYMVLVVGNPRSGLKRFQKSVWEKCNLQEESTGNVWRICRAGRGHRLYFREEDGIDVHRLVRGDRSWYCGYCYCSYE